MALYTIYGTKIILGVNKYLLWKYLSPFLVVSIRVKFLKARDHNNEGLKPITWQNNREWNVSQRSVKCREFFRLLSFPPTGKVDPVWVR